MKKFFVFFVFLVSFLGAEERNALVIGNSSYNFAPSVSSVRDAEVVSEALRELKFEVSLIQNTGREALLEALDSLPVNPAFDGTFLFYFSGIAVQAEGENYLLPADTEIQSPDDVFSLGVPLGQILERLSGIDKNKLVIIDAARETPLNEFFEPGLAPVESGIPDLFVLMSTGPGEVLLDNNEETSRLTRSLVTLLKEPGRSASEIFSLASDEVSADTGGDEIPWFWDNLSDALIFREKVYGSVKIFVEASGTVIIDGESFPMVEGEEMNETLLEGLHKIVYQGDGTEETKTVEIKEGETAEITFYGKKVLFGVDMVPVEAGEFLMGSPESEKYRDKDEIQHSVVVETPFYMGKYEVSQDLWNKVMGNNPSEIQGDNLPVVNVSWMDAVVFCNQLSILEGREPVYTVEDSTVECDFTKNGYRLPTEAEWEFASRGGAVETASLYSGHNEAESAAWSRENSEGAPKEVGVKEANTLGIYDMSGNVWEWCWDYYKPYMEESVFPGSYRVFRGGSWENYSILARSANRGFYNPDESRASIGFRLVYTE